MTGRLQDVHDGSARDEAFADLISMESRRRNLEAMARRGDEQAQRDLSALRPQLSKQAIVAADLDRAADLAFGGRNSEPHEDARAAESRLADLYARRLELARQIESNVVAIRQLCHQIEENADALVQAHLDLPPVMAELGRFREQFCFYLESMFDFMTGAGGIAGHPSYRKLTEVMLDGEAILKLYRRAAGECGGSGVVRDTAVPIG